MTQFSIVWKHTDMNFCRQRGVQRQGRAMLKNCIYYFKVLWTQSNGPTFSVQLITWVYLQCLCFQTSSVFQSSNIFFVSSPAPYLFLSVKPSVHHGMVGAKGRSSHLSLELSGPATCITGKTPIGMASSTLQSNTKMWRDQHHCVTITQKLLYKEKVYTAATNKWLGEKISNLKSFINKQIQRLIQPPYFCPLNRFLWV